LILLVFATAVGGRPETGEDELVAGDKATVVLVHGMGRTRASLWILEYRLRAAGFETANFPYSAATTSLDELATGLRAFVHEEVRTERYHLAGHSLGNIIIRRGFAEGYREGLTRVVMLAPPNQPQPLAEKLQENPIYQLWSGDSGRKLASEDFYADLPIPDVPFGVIAADKGQSLTFDEPNDGIVPVRTTKLAGMADWILLHHTHTFMMNAADTADQVVHFLREGKFARPETESE
jgi:hypothetical protein